MAVCPNCGEENPDKAKFCLECATPLTNQSAPPQEARKTVTILFCDLVGSTALGERLDSESLREVMDRYFVAMRASIERHGGTVEKFIGDAVMAVFGLPRVHEDDALRAVRAAEDMRRAVSSLNPELRRHWGVAVSNRIGVNTGEVVVGDPSSGQRLATGDAVNVAARLEQAAPAGHVLLGEPTHSLVRDAVVAETVEPLVLKGKSKPLPAFRLLEVRAMAEGVARRLDGPLVGREEEMGSLLAVFERNARERACGFTIVAGDPGVGKSRLVAEVRARLRERARVVSGRCLSYGEGTAFWPLRGVVFDLVAAPEDASGNEIRDALTALVEDAHVVERMVAAIGLSAESFPPEETAWAVRRLLEAAARPSPLVVVIEDLHWADAALVNVLAHLAETSPDVPLALVCTARPEFLEEQRGWLEALPRTTVHVLEPLSQAASAELLADLLAGAAVAPEIVARITQAAAGNPLYIEQITSMWLDEGVLARADGHWRLAAAGIAAPIPPTISALLSARLDRLAPGERAVAAAASVVGQVFYRGAVESLSPEAEATHFVMLEHKGFVRRDDAVFFDEEVFVFRHALIREAAYAAILKRTRAELHEKFAEWLEGKAGERAGEYDEILGHHLYEAYRYRQQLGTMGEAERALGGRAAVYLASAGRRALGRQDPSASTLLERATRLFSPSHPEVPGLLIDMGESFRRSEMMQRAEAAFTRGLELARAISDRHVEARATLFLLNLEIDEGRISLDGLLTALGNLKQEAGNAWNAETAAHASALLGAAYINRGALARARAEWGSAVEQGDKSESIYIQSETRVGELLASLWGPDEIRDVEGRARGCLRWSEGVGALRLRAAALGVLAMGSTMRGREDEATDLLEELSNVQAHLGMSAIAGEAWSVVEPDVHILREDWATAERLLTSHLGLLERIGVPTLMTVDMAQLGEVLYRQGRIGQAEEYAQRVIAIQCNLMDPEIRARKLLGKCLASGGRGGETVASEAVEMAQGTDMINLTADTLCDLTEVLTMEDAPRRRVRERLEEALALYEHKGNVVSVTKVRSWLAHLEATSRFPTAPRSTSGRLVPPPG